MKSKILYLSLSGNTRKVAQAIADEINCDDLIDVNGLSDDEMKSFWEDDAIDIYFIGTGVYASRVGGDLRRFLTNNKASKSKKFALFGTWVGRARSGPKTFNRFAKFLKKENHKIIGEHFLSLGKFGAFQTTHPDEKDLQNARNWAKNIVNLL
ncbi:MAG: hypothetical protein GY870_07255 [archaeon]|nr:hypothetical protein [archaeon]